MRRRSKRGPNNSEATGKIGQEIPTDQPAALRPSYPEANRSKAPAAPQEPTEMPLEAQADEPEDTAPGDIVLETQPELLSTPPAEPQVISQQGEKPAPKGFVVLAIGLPGSGKTTWYKRRGVTPLSSDLLRTILFDDITDQRYSGLVFSTLRSLLRARLIAKMPWNYVDATNLSAHERRQWIKMAKSFGYEAQAVFFDVPLAVCMERNSKRERRVADDVMEKMSERLRPPSFREGFSKITVVRVKGQPGSTAPSGIAEPTPEAFNTPVAPEPESDNAPLDLDEPANFEEPSNNIDDPSSNLDEPSGTFASGSDGASHHHSAPSGDLNTPDQPDTFE